MSLEGDVSEPGLGLDPGPAAELRDRVTHIVHAAADLRFDASVEERTRSILAAVQSRGDAAVLEFTEKFDGAKLEAGNSARGVSGRPDRS